MKVLVLCAGHGTRLRPLTENFAKPALPIAGIPTLWFPVWSILRELQPDKWIVNAGHAADSVAAALDLAELRSFARISFEVSDESAQVLGSSGALWKIKNQVGSDRLLVVNGDSICFSPWRKMLEFHVTRKALLTMHVRAFDREGEPYTNIAVDSKGVVTALGAKTERGVMFSGAYIVESSVLERLPSGVSELRPSLLEPLCREGALYAFREDVPRFEMGTVRSFFEAQFKVPAKAREARPLLETRMREKAPGIWVPKAWPASTKLKAEVKGPAVLVGSAENWERAEGVFGPRFCGVTDYLGAKGAPVPDARSEALFFLNQFYPTE